MNKTKILTQQRLLTALSLVLGKKIDSEMPPLTENNQMKPETIRWQRQHIKHRDRIRNLSEVTRTDKEGKESEYIPEDDEILLTLRDERKELTPSIPDESPYHLSFPWQEMREALYYRCDGQDRTLFEYLYFDDLTYEQIAKRMRLSIRQVRNREKKLAEKVALEPHLIELLYKKASTRKRGAKLLREILSRRG